MVKLLISVKEAAGYNGEPQISRELIPGDDRSLKQYAYCLLAEPPQNPAELDALVAMYDQLEGSIGTYTTRPTPSNGIETNRHLEEITINDLVKEGEDADLLIGKIRPDVEFAGIILTMPNNAEYLEFKREQHAQQVEAYRQWQSERM